MLEKIVAMLLALLELFLPGGVSPTGAELTGFGYAHTASYIEGIYSYEITRGEDGVTAYCERNCGRDTYSFPLLEEDVEELRAIIDRNAIWKWHGFDKTARNVLDGSSFSLHAEFADGTCISAQGYARFPEGHGTAKSEIEALFGRILARNGYGP